MSLGTLKVHACFHPKNPIASCGIDRAVSPPCSYRSLSSSRSSVVLKLFPANRDVSRCSRPVTVRIHSRQTGSDVPLVFAFLMTIFVTATTAYSGGLVITGTSGLQIELSSTRCRTNRYTSTKTIASCFTILLRCIAPSCAQCGSAVEFIDLHESALALARG